MTAEEEAVATTSPPPLTEEEASTSEPTLVPDLENLEGLENLEETLKDEAVDPYNLEESNVNYECVEQYVEALNSDSRLRPEVSEDERQLLDQVLYNFEENPNLSKDLINCYLRNIIKPKPACRKQIYNKPKEGKLSNRKKRKLYADFQRLHI